MTMTQDELVRQLQDEMYCKDCLFDETDMNGFHEEEALAQTFFKKKKGFTYRVQVKHSGGLKNLSLEFHRQEEIFMFAREFSKHDIAICVYVNQWDSYGVLTNTWTFVNGTKTTKEV